MAQSSWVLHSLSVSILAVISIAQAPHALARGHRGTADAVTLADCPVGGDAQSARVRALNALKRRIQTPGAADIDPNVTLAAMLRLGADEGRFDTERAATVEGYVADVKVGGVESVNCHTHDSKYRDTHIELTLDPLHDDESKHVIVEVTPQWREAMVSKGVDWQTKTLRQVLVGRWIKVTGWLLYDEEHRDASLNTARPGAHVWRATAWEVHPVTAIAVLAAKPRP